MPKKDAENDSDAFSGGTKGFVVGALAAAAAILLGMAIWNGIVSGEAQGPQSAKESQDVPLNAGTPDRASAGSRH
ncbi:hypothetical protein [Nitratireductor sp. ZSWI3]|uniref:hypothetical protein n=1 Tax=Nitratireductor sp. ZSWI3 TaxID=2966359 RepID=UPI00214FFD12|nr:hypothetical protein [Nitratireductor sp. ZSWI3]MCR4266573.1 hypothetical protein [Nitratireductor sp. ZSWI3]